MGRIVIEHKKEDHDAKGNNSGTQGIAAGEWK